MQNTQQRPQYQKLYCKDHDKEITQINVSPADEVYQGDKRRLLCLECKQIDSTNFGNDCIMDDIFKDPLKVFATTYYLQSVNQNFCSFYLQLKPDLNTDQLKKKLKDLFSNLINEVKQLEKKWLDFLDQYSKYIRQFDELLKKFEERLDPSKILEALQKFDTTKEQDSYHNLNNIIEEYVVQIHKKRSDDDILSEKIDKLRTSQELYYNENQYSIKVNEIKGKIKDLSNIFYKSSLPQSVLSNQYFDEVLKLIKNDYKPQVDKDKIQLLYRMSDEGKDFKLFTKKFEQLIKQPVLIIFQTEQRKLFGVYGDYVTKYGSQKKEDKSSFIFDALKSQIFKSTNTTNPIEINLDEKQNILIQIGNEDILIKPDFQGKSEVNKAFICKELKIAQSTSYLAGITEFKIVNMEIFAVNFVQNKPFLPGPGPMIQIPQTDIQASQNRLQTLPFSPFAPPNLKP